MTGRGSSPPAVLRELSALARTGNAEEFRARLLASRETLFRWLIGFHVEGAPEDLAATYVHDALQRFLHTLALVPLPAGPRILEIGANPFYFHLLLRRIFPESELTGTGFIDRDVRSAACSTLEQRTSNAETGESEAFTVHLFNLESVPRYPFDAGRFDLVFFCETLEHLAFDPLPVFRKLRRVLAPGGTLIVTLPNAVRLANFALMLEGENVFDLYFPGNGLYGRHHREYTLGEMTSILEAHGFAVTSATTEDRYDYDVVDIETKDYTGLSRPLRRRRKDLLRVLKKAGGSLKDRGDNLYLVARRPADRPGLTAPAPRQEGSETFGPLPDSPRLVTFVDIVRDSPAALEMEGWAFLRDDPGAEGDELLLALESSDGRLTARGCARVDRMDVTAAFGVDGSSGFSVRVDKAGLPAGPYRVGLVLRGPGLPLLYARTPLTTRVG